MSICNRCHQGEERTIASASRWPITHLPAAGLSLICQPLLAYHLVFSDIAVLLGACDVWLLTD
jgi:hypothetical protein